MANVPSCNALSLQILKYGFVICFNLIMWGCYVNSLKALSSLQATVTNFAANFLSSGLAGYFLFEEPLPARVIFCMDPCKDVYTIKKRVAELINFFFLDHIHISTTKIFC